MKLVVAMDSFKGSIDSLAAGEAVARGLGRAAAEAEVQVLPFADGGEGTVDAIIYDGGVRRTVAVTGPLGTPVDATYGIKGEVAVIEMAAAAGLTLVPPAARDPRHTTTRGVGELILDAMDRGCRKFIVGIGGSATNDGGVGMLQALGFDFLDAAGAPVPHGAKGLAALATVSTKAADQRLGGCEFFVACDVKNPLCGENGCSAIYGPQKGATPETVQEMDAAMAQYAAITQAILPRADANHPGVGAAGGLGFAFHAYLGATLTPGAPLVIRETGLEAAIKGADLVVTGEGRLDGQSAMGKAPVAVAALAKKYQKPVIALAGCVAPEATACHAHGIDAFFPILRTPCTVAEAMQTATAAENLAATAEQALRLWLCGRGTNV
ncbi:MAG: glycerate kinase [Clostridia bacterium]|nr:glycerate kinase [Clostridia bacterium]